MNTPAAPAPTPATRKAQALQRLDASRTRLIQQLFPPPPEPGQPAADSGAWLQAVLGRVGRDGWVRGGWRAVRALTRRWWQRQPWHTPVALAARALAQEARPLLRRHPWACLGAAAAAGAALVVARPWLTRNVRQRALGLPGQLGATLWQQLAQAPVQLALAGAISAWLAERQRRNETPPH